LYDRIHSGFVVFVERYNKMINVLARSSYITTSKLYGLEVVYLHYLVDTLHILTKLFYDILIIFSFYFNPFTSFSTSLKRISVAIVKYPIDV
jgi:hypothetical protein